jgi:hypothetical protein
MNADRRHTWGLIIDVLDVLEQHGYHQADDQHTGRAVGLVGDLARIYEGAQETPAGASARPEPEPRQSSTDRRAQAPTPRAEAIAGAGMHTILMALDEAADYKRGRAECCADCADQSCGLCQHRLHAVRTYETLAVRLLRAMDAAPPEKPPPRVVASRASGRIQPESAPEREAGQ